MSLGLATAGILLVTLLVVSGFGELNPAGIVTALASALFLAVYTLASDAAIRTATPVDVATETFLWATPLSVLVFFLGGSPTTVFSVSNVGPMLFVGIFGALLGTGLYIWGVDRVHSVKASIAANLEPVAALVLAWLWFGQVLSPLQVLGALLILGAVALLHDSGKREVIRSGAGIEILEGKRWPRQALLQENARRFLNYSGKRTRTCTVDRCETTGRPRDPLRGNGCPPGPRQDRHLEPTG